MTGILAGLRIVEGSAFIAAPLGGMTLAQLGADVIRFDDIKGGLDNDRWPITKDGRSIYWAGLNKGKRSIAVDLRNPKGRELPFDLAWSCRPRDIQTQHGALFVSIEALDFDVAQRSRRKNSSGHIDGLCKRCVAA